MNQQQQDPANHSFAARTLAARTPVSPKASVDAERKLRGSIAKQKPPSFFAKLFTRGVKSIIGDKRERCCVVGVLVLLDKTIPLDGLVTEIGVQGITFRPASSHILERGGAEVLLRFAERELRGRIERTTTHGYDIRLQQALPESALNEIANTFGLGDRGILSPAATAA